MYSLHMRKNIIDIKTNEKLSIRAAARRFGISPNTVYEWGKKIEPKGWRKQRVSKIDIRKLEEDVSNNPDAYQYERAKRLKVSQAAVHFGLKRLEKWQTRREKISKYYIETFADTPLDFIVPNKNCTSNFHKFVLLHERRDAIHDHLKANHIDAQKHYTDSFNDFFGDKKEMPNTVMLCNSVLSIPNNQWLTDAEVETVAETIKKFF